MLEAYGHGSSSETGATEQTGTTDVYEEYNQAVASNTDGAKDKTFREWVKADEIKKAAKWYTNTRAHGEAPDEIDPDAGPSDDEIKGLINKDHQERLNAREGRSNPTEDDIAYYRWLKNLPQKETDNDEPQPEPPTTDPNAPTEPLPIESKDRGELKQEIIKNHAFAKEDSKQLLIELYKSYSDYNIAHSEYAKKKRPSIIDIGSEKAARDKYEAVRKDVATHLKHQLEINGLKDGEDTEISALEQDLENMAKEAVVGVTMRDRIDEILKKDKDSKNPQTTEVKLPPKANSPNEGGDDGKANPLATKTEVKEPEPKTEAKWVYSPEEVTQKMTELTEKFKNRAVVPTPKEYAEIRKIADHINRQTVSSNSGRDMTAYHFIGDEKQSFDAVLAKPFFDLANPRSWRLPDKDVKVYEAFVQSGDMEDLPKRYESGKKGALMTKSEFAKLREEAIDEEVSSQEAKMKPKEKANHIRADYMEYVKRNLALSEQAKKLLPAEESKSRGRHNLIKRPAVFSRRSAGKPKRR